MKRLFLLPLLLGAVAVQAEPAAVLRDAALHAEPYIDADTITALKPGDQVEALERRGGWFRVRLADGTEGWARLTALRLGKPGESGNSGVGATLNLLTTGRSGASGVTAATGIRGLDKAKAIQQATDEQAVEAMETHAASADEARAYAEEVPLESRELDYLPEHEEAPESPSDSDASATESNPIFGGDW